ncbi:MULTISPECIES: undecaprenyl diphosphate synthase family protein [unclassified Archaeoglobus]|uniref:undecaprenyl diphosphate synthase family protein n=1 Tax=unclassified Archaeoglobus TaxID=2643606 RepID=UPI0025C7021F|nr:MULTISPECIES: undecaprenyl diphosphate synthase family protein [unclassified Archaeoglobus]
MLLKIYEKLLEREIEKVPKHIVVISNHLGEGFLKFINWCRRFGVEEITVCSHNEINRDFIKGFRVRIIENELVKESEGEPPTVNIIAGYTGHEEILNTIKKLAEMVIAGELKPEDVDEKTFERFLAVKTPPDIIIKAGNEVPEFMIWQGIYSELYFADVDWDNFRYVDFLRILREYQRRERRYGR